MKVSKLVSPITIGIGGALIARLALKRLNEYRLKDRVVLISGGSRGLGLVLAREFGKEGARLVICSRDPDEIDRAHQDLSKRGHDVISIKCDVTKQADVNEMIARV